MSPLNDYFDQILLIHLPRRQDRLSRCIELLNRFEISARLIEGYDLPGDENRGCTQAHCAALHLIGHHKWQRTLILEDDFEPRGPDLNEQFARMVRDVPLDWEMLYLGGHYAEAPQARVSQHVIRIGRMMTTSSYAVTYEFARRKAPYMDGHGPIDTLYYDDHLNRPCYIFQPRLMVQRPGFSEIQQRDMNNTPCMEDPNHENLV